MLSKSTVHKVIIENKEANKKPRGENFFGGTMFIKDLGDEHLSAMTRKAIMKVIFWHLTFYTPITLGYNYLPDLQLIQQNNIKSKIGISLLSHLHVFQK